MKSKLTNVGAIMIIALLWVGCFNSDVPLSDLPDNEIQAENYTFEEEVTSVLPGDADPGINLKLLFQSPMHMNSNINRAISITYYEVYLLEISLLHLETQYRQEISWTPNDGNQLTLALPEIGEYEITIIHHGRDDAGNDIQQTESATFEIKPYFISIITITPGAIGNIDIDDYEEVKVDWDFTAVTKLPAPLYNSRNPDTISFSETGTLMTNDITDKFNNICYDLATFPSSLNMLTTVVNKHRESVPYYTFSFGVYAVNIDGSISDFVYILMTDEDCIMRKGFGIDDSSSMRERYGTGYSPWGSQYYYGNPEYTGWNENWTLLEDIEAVFNMNIDFNTGQVTGTVSANGVEYESTALLKWIPGLSTHPEFDHLKIMIQPSTWWTDNFWTEVKNLSIAIVE